MRLSLLSLGLSAYIALIGIQPAFAIPSLSTEATTSASNLPLDGEGTATTHVVKVATLSLSTASSKGFTLTISSGNLTNSGLQTPISYQVITSATSTPNSADFTVASGNNYTFVTTQAGSQTRDLYVLYSPANMQDPGTYIGNIAISITDNP